MPFSPNHREKHNAAQKHYYDGPPKKNMVPKNSNYLWRHVQKFLAAAGIQKQARLLEIGCGMGRYTLLLAEQGFHVTGLDISQNLLEYLKGYNNKRFDIALVCGDIIADELQFAEEFEAVVGFFVLHHLHDLTLCFQSMKRFLKKDGLIAFLEPNPFNPLYYAQMVISPTMSWQGDKGILQMREAVIRESMQRAGFALIKVERFGFFPPFVTNGRYGLTLESSFEKIALLKPFFPFQIFVGKAA
ncbi:MAG: class I SAM-dependent methyltransferase [Ardenticatenaceae bacterium]|nr:class I SAM-dependent methyltransferase [Ardenticatenaceae bacterium]